FYPEEGVSAVQKRQMTTSRGANVNVAAVKGNFDDCQRLVKAAYGNEDVRRAAGKSVCLSSANSINLGRLLPQIVYYYAAYAALVRRGAIACGDKILFSVPTGNFGDILAGYLAKRMGLPVSKLLCASNENRVLTDFLETGIYDARRPLRLTMSPSMDILISSNLERLLFDASGADDGFVRSAMADLKEKGVFTADAAVMEKIRAVFAGYETDEAECAAFLRTLWEREGLLVDPHTAVAAASLGKYREDTGDVTPAVVLSTASPFKFCRDVLSSIFPEETGLADEFAMMDRLAERTGIRPPAPLAELRGRQVRFTDSISREEGMTYLGGLLRRLAQQ
ncbi:MAG: pyridoxal-phosphate dependent enzyme, partial [Lachnospiraceae bacterium]|nr:pyridoxal-phosphate dependent enzyme [Lachnospiraceae bacterium]